MGIIFSAYLTTSMNSPAWEALHQPQLEKKETEKTEVDLSKHQQWNHQPGWKNTLNNLRLVIQLTIDTVSW